MVEISLSGSGEGPGWATAPGFSTATHLSEEATEEAALRFVDAVDAAFRRLADTPEVGRLREFRSPRLAGLRSWPVLGFPKHRIAQAASSDR
jgi:toxin ParE1/3/4